MFRVFLLTFSLFFLVSLNSAPLKADLAFGGAWKNLVVNNQENKIKAKTSDRLSSFLSVFKNFSQLISETSLTIGYTLPAFGTVILETDDEKGVGSFNYYSSLKNKKFNELKKVKANSIPGENNFGAINGIENESYRFLIEPVSEKGFGALLDYEGFYLSGTYKEVASLRSLSDTQVLWQAGLGFGSKVFDLNFSYRQMAFSQPQLTDLEGKRWMVGGMINLSPSLFVDANAFYFDRDRTVSQIDAPQKGARLGVRLKF